MSQVSDFLAKVESDATLKQKFASLETNQEIVDLANEHGYSFSIEEYQQELEEKLDLDKIVGGASMRTGVSTCPYSG